MSGKPTHGLTPAGSFFFFFKPVCCLGSESSELCFKVLIQSLSPGEVIILQFLQALPSLESAPCFANGGKKVSHCGINLKSERFSFLSFFFGGGNLCCCV